MKLKNDSLLTAVTVGVVVQLFYYLAYLLAVYSVYTKALDIQVLAPRFSNVLTVLGFVMVLVSGVGTGFLYAVLHGRSEPVMPIAARGGATAGAITFALGIVIMGILTAVILLPLLGNEAVANASSEGWVSTENVSQVLGLGIAGVLGGTVFLSGVMAFLGAILGGLGGGLGGVFMVSR